ncbi:CYFA0S08e02476g1_1 [Cyberlindnera fabianii]|uniref:CYFA0S08e02476g1_1 n=1 Tax=Cyberlindnera fabianii TaxID=36022 RepID=A0A061B307_CYBFA|nr:CYFA0S08e02476g1_1 [Cyberlindnera fabianii]
MLSSNNLAAMFAQSQHQQPPQKPSQGSRADVYSAHHSTSKAVDATDDDHFENTSFQLKRTRSMGLLDEFIAPTRKLIEEDDLVPTPGNPDNANSPPPSPKAQPEVQPEITQTAQPTPQRQPAFQSTSLELDFDDSDDGQFIENVDETPAIDSSKKKNRNVQYTYNDEANDYDDDSLYDDHTQNSKMSSNNENNAPSLSPPSSPDAYQPHDDNDIEYEPSRHVDYFSHNWKESDLSKSWRYIVLKRKDVANSARLENASWRTWAQAKYHLKTVSPESVNWLKDSDVTWLYGPLYKESEQANAEETEKKYGSDGESSTLNAIKRGKQKKLPSTTPGSTSSPSTKTQRMQHFAKTPKPILKKRTVSEMLTQPSMIRLPHHHHPPVQQVNPRNTPSPPVFEDDFDMITKKVNAQYHQKRPDSPLSTVLSDTASQEQPKRHIHFNDRVEQCIALSYPETDDESCDNDIDGDDEGYENDDDDDDDDEDEGGFFLNVKSPSTATLHRDFASTISQSSLDSDDDDEGSHASSSLSARKMLKIIEPLPATTLNYGSDEEEDNDDEQFAVSHGFNSSRGYNYLYDYNSVFTGEDNNLVHVGNSDYQVDDSVQLMEGVDMVDVPEDIVLGSNIEVMDTPESMIPSPQTTQPPPLQLPRTHSHQQQHTPPVQIPQAGQSQHHETPLKKSGSAFNLHSDSESESDLETEAGPDVDNQNSSPQSSSSVQRNITKISSSPSSASLSDVAAQGYISQQSPNDLTGLQKEFGQLNTNDDKGKGFKAALMNSWKK